MTTELCAYSVEACETARRAGVTRVELCASPYEGGTTPSAAAIRMARRIGGLQLSVMVRPRGGDFLYSDTEFRQMLEEVRFARECGADGVVFGVLSCVFGTQLLGLYSLDPAVIQVGLNRMYIVCGPYFLCGIMDVMTGVLRGVGYSLLPMIVSLMGACVFRIFWVMTIFAANRTMDCLMISYPVSWALTFLVLVVIFAVLWKKKIRPRYTPEELAAR